MSEITSRLSTALADRYRIERELGAGGMATVYLAEDLKHKREVAVKVLRPELAAAVGAERFLREIEIAASLTHPHILPLHDSGNADGFLYYVMPYIEGESLRERLDREGALPPQVAAQVLKEVVDALAHAHEHGVVHRDVKPDNVLLSGKHALVTDFGVAKAVSSASTDSDLTMAGIVLGTPTYMAPEQAVADPNIDHRADIYAVGVMGYEMVTGRPPFAGPSAQAVLAAHVTEAPVPVTQRQTSVPPGLGHFIMRSLEKEPGDRWQTTAEVLVHLETLSSSSDAVTPVGATRLQPSDSSSQWPLRRMVGIMAIALVLGVVGWLGWPRSPAPAEPPKVAVLPFQNLGSSEDEFFADGITEEITSRLAEIGGLRVTSRTSALSFKGHTGSIRDVGRALLVDYVLEGTIRTDRLADGSGQVRVTPQLIRVPDDVHLWTDRYTVDLTPGEIFAVQATIAEQVAIAMNVTLLEPEREAIAAGLTEDAEAHDAYLLGRFHWNKRTEEALQLAAEHFHRAVARDSTFARAYAGLADTYVLYPFYPIGTISSAEAFDRARRAATRALALDSTLVGARTSLAYISYLVWDWEEADGEFRRAISLDPDYVVARYWYAEYLIAVGRFVEAIEQSERAVELDPLSMVAHLVLGIALGSERRLDESVESFRRASELQPSSSAPHLFLAFAYGSQRLPDQAAEELGSLGIDPKTVQSLARAFAGDADFTIAPSLMPSVERNAVLGDPVLMALVYSRIGLPDSAFAKLEVAFRTRSVQLGPWKWHPWFDDLRDDSRFVDLSMRMGLRR